MKNSMERCGGGMRVSCCHELAAMEALQRGLHRAFGQTGGLGNHPQACADR